MQPSFLGARQLFGYYCNTPTRTLNLLPGRREKEGGEKEAGNNALVQGAPISGVRARGGHAAGVGGEAVRDGSFSQVS